jgi:hypothetical protein
MKTCDCPTVVADHCFLDRKSGKIQKMQSDFFSKAITFAQIVVSGPFAEIS